MEGRDASGLKDTNGKHIIQEIVKAGAAGGGFIDYWFPKAGATEALPKVSYAMGFAPWGWIIGTGIYVDDVDREFRAIALTLGGISLLLLALMGLFGWRISVSVTGQLGGEPQKATAVMRQAADGDLTTEVGETREGSMLNALATMMRALRRMVGEINDGANQLVGNADHIAGSPARWPTPPSASPTPPRRWRRRWKNSPSAPATSRPAPAKPSATPRSRCASPPRAAPGSAKPSAPSARCRKP
jgi:methyl-accepting chemotaxis protein